MKICTECGSEKPKHEFYKTRGRNGGLRSGCKECDSKRQMRYHDTSAGQNVAKNANLKWKYGITLKDYNTMLKDQGSRCAICGTEVPGGQGNFHVDHIKRTNPIIVRGLLCNTCNPGLGCFKHDIKILARAILYLSADYGLSCTPNI